jgi:hypothetical protein
MRPKTGSLLIDGLALTVSGSHRAGKSTLARTMARPHPRACSTSKPLGMQLGLGEPALSLPALEGTVVDEAQRHQNLSLVLRLDEVRQRVLRCRGGRSDASLPTRTLDRPGTSNGILPTSMSASAATMRPLLGRVGHDRLLRVRSPRCTCVTAAYRTPQDRNWSRTRGSCRGPCVPADRR